MKRPELSRTGSTRTAAAVAGATVLTAGAVVLVAVALFTTAPPVRIASAAFTTSSVTTGRDDYPAADQIAPVGADDTVTGFAMRNCTDFVAWRLRHEGIAFTNQYRNPAQGFWGNAGQWTNAARQTGIPVSSTPQVGDVAVFPPDWAGTNGDYVGSAGHVAIVDHVGQGTVTVEDYNYFSVRPGTAGHYHRHTMATASTDGTEGPSFLHFPTAPAPPSLRLPATIGPHAPWTDPSPIVTAASAMAIGQITVPPDGGRSAGPLFNASPGGAESLADAQNAGYCQNLVMANTDYPWLWPVINDVAVWPKTARDHARTTDLTPATGAIVVFNPGHHYWSDQHYWNYGDGHVAIVTNVTADSYTVAEFNFHLEGGGTHIMDLRRIPWPDPHPDWGDGPSVLAFIH